MAYFSDAHFLWRVCCYEKRGTEGEESPQRGGSILENHFNFRRCATPPDHDPDPDHAAAATTTTATPRHDRDHENGSLLDQLSRSRSKCSRARSAPYPILTLRKQEIGIPHQLGHMGHYVLSVKE